MDSFRFSPKTFRVYGAFKSWQLNYWKHFLEECPQLNPLNCVKVVKVEWQADSRHLKTAIMADSWFTWMSPVSAAAHTLFWERSKWWLQLYRLIGCLLCDRSSASASINHRLQSANVSRDLMDDNNGGLFLPGMTGRSEHQKSEVFLLFLLVDGVL